MGESPFCSTAHIDTFGGVRVLFGPTVTCNEGEVAFTFIDNAVQSTIGQRRTRRVRGLNLNRSFQKFRHTSRFSARMDKPSRVAAMKWEADLPLVNPATAAIRHNVLTRKLLVKRLDSLEDSEEDISGHEGYQHGT